MFSAGRASSDQMTSDATDAMIDAMMRAGQATIDAQMAAHDAAQDRAAVEHAVADHQAADHEAADGGVLKVGLLQYGYAEPRRFEELLRARELNLLKQSGKMRG